MYINFGLEKNVKDILLIYLNQEQIDELERRWNEPHRKWHNTIHLINFLNEIEKLRISTGDKKVMIFAAFYHDVVYEIGSSTNEEDSIKLLKKHIKDEDFVEMVSDLIECTKSNVKPNDYFESLFWKIDNDVLLKGSIQDLIDYEKKIAAEYLSIYTTEEYKKGRIDFLKTRLGSNTENIKKLIKWVNEQY